jgi:hypothetical protein
MRTATPGAGRPIAAPAGRHRVLSAEEVGP